MSIHVLAPGLLSSVQDLGRHGLAAIGVGVAGPMDTVSARLANLLVDNPPAAALLEITLLGPRLRFDADALIALTGAQFDATCSGEPVPTWRPVAVRRGSELHLGTARRGCRAYLAVAGGIDVPLVLGSRSSDINAGIGAPPRALCAGDVLPLSESMTTFASRMPASTPTGGSQRQRADRAGAPALRATTWALDAAPWFDADGRRPIRAIIGSHFADLDADSQTALFVDEFRVGVDSNRVGTRLEGHDLRLSRAIELVSTGVATGTVQLPPGGIPIALTAEAPTTGGYPRIAHIVAVDQPRFAQLRPGDRVRFVRTDLADAQQRLAARERALAKLDGWVRARLRDTRA